MSYKYDLLHLLSLFSFLPLGIMFIIPVFRTTHASNLSAVISQTPNFQDLTVDLNSRHDPRHVSKHGPKENKAR